MGTLIVVLILIAVLVLAVLSVIRRVKYGSSCCGTHDAVPSKIKVRDKNASHYQYAYNISIDGMHCSHCVRRVENALNLQDGVWAKVSLEKKSALVRSKCPLKEKAVSKIVSDAGYTVTRFEKI